MATLYLWLRWWGSSPLSLSSNSSAPSLASRSRSPQNRATSLRPSIPTRPAIMQGSPLPSKKCPCGHFSLAPGVGIEPTTKRLTVFCSTAELPRNTLEENLQVNIILANTPRKGKSKPGTLIYLPFIPKYAMLCLL